MALATDFLAYGTLLLDLSFVLAILAFGYNRVSGNCLDQINSYEKLKNILSSKYRELSLLIAFVATSGSLYLSNFLGWAPCRLCWFQRIFMYPLVIIILVAIVFDDKNIKDYVMPLSITGLAIALYHYAIQRVSQFQSAGCSITSVSCNTEYTFHFGYITIPMMAATAFLAIIILMWRFSNDK